MRNSKSYSKDFSKILHYCRQVGTCNLFTKFDGNFRLPLEQKYYRKQSQSLQTASFQILHVAETIHSYTPLIVIMGVIEHAIYFLLAKFLQKYETTS